MAIYTDRIVLVFPIESKNRQAAASLQTLEVTESGKEFEAVVPLDPALVKDYAAEFNLGALGQVEELEATIATLEKRITELEQYRPYNPRWLDGVAFYKRISQQDMETLLASDNPQLVTVGKTILAYRDNHKEWPVILDSPDFQNLVGYVLQSHVFDDADVEKIMQDATREEAYNAE